jgi:hypothetical protein
MAHASCMLRIQRSGYRNNDNGKNEERQLVDDEDEKVFALVHGWDKYNTSMAKFHKVDTKRATDTIISVKHPSNDQLHYQLDRQQQAQQHVHAPLSTLSICINNVIVQR